MLVKEKIKNENSFVVTKNGKFLIIKNPDRDIHFTNDKKYTKEKILNMEISKIELLKGQYADYIAIRL